MNDLQPAQVVLALSGLQFLYSIFQEVWPYYPVRIYPKMDPANGQNMDPMASLIAGIWKPIPKT